MSFTPEQVKKFRSNPYTEFVSENVIRYTLEFKELFLKRTEEGASAIDIFTESGYDPVALGGGRIRLFKKRLLDSVKTPEGIHEGYKKSGPRKPPVEMEKLSLEDRQKNLEGRVFYLERQMTFLKKTLALETSGECRT